MTASKVCAHSWTDEDGCVNRCNGPQTIGRYCEMHADFHADAFKAELTRLRAENEELRKDVVFCARNAIEFFITTTGPCIGRFYTVTYTRGTDDEVTAAVRQARQKGE
jgi:hypothetical protein